ncbi:MAG TPA: DUF2279 domain-containing protein [Rhodothermales bacterium]|nr:DUF2279 domain-containing protein [Rhodothermales bacterium]
MPLRSSRILLLMVLLATGAAAQAPDSTGVPGVPAADEAAPVPSVLDSAAVRRFHPTRFYAGLGIAIVADAAVMAGLAGLWYTGERVPFHWFSESGDYGSGIPSYGWLDDWYTDAQMDKGGHFVTTWQLTRLAGGYARWSGLSNRRAALAGALFATAFQTQIELLDGFDPLYGASRTDLLANVAGAAVGYVQVAHPDRTDWFTAKVSYHPTRFYDRDLTPYPPLTYVGNGIKDYEGLTYWLVVRPARMGAPAWWPRWLGVSVGYGADGLTGFAPVCCESDPNVRRELYLSLDFDVLESERHRLPRVLRPVASVLSVVRFPLPAYEIGGRGRHWHWLYY